MITPELVRAATFRLTLHARLAKGGSLYQYQCVEFPRLVKVKSRANRAAPIEVQLYCDELPIECSATAAAAALNKQPDKATEESNVAAVD